MIVVLLIVAGALTVASVAVAAYVLLHDRRWAAEVAEHDRLECRVRPLALALLDEESPGGEALVETLDDRETTVLTELLARYAEVLRGGSVDRLRGYFERSGAVDLQIRRLRHRRPVQRIAAALSLGTMASPTAVARLIQALADPEPGVRSAVAQALGRIGAPEAADALLLELARGTLPHAVTAEALLRCGPAVTPTIRNALGSHRPDVRAVAAELLGDLGEPCDVPALLERLHDTSAAVRAATADALGHIGDVRASPALRVAADDRIPTVRAAATTALASIEDSTVDQAHAA